MDKSSNRHSCFIDLKEPGFHYIDWGGEGPTIHIAHATGLCAGAYSTLAESLTDHNKVVGLDFRGHGLTEARAEPRKLKNWHVFYDDLECFFDQLKGPIISIGHSLGGTSSLKLAATRPDLVSALILIEPGIMPPAWRPFVYLGIVNK